MERNQGRRMSAEEKLRVVGEGRQSGATISEVCGCHHQLASNCKEASPARRIGQPVGVVSPSCITRMDDS